MVQLLFSTFIHILFGFVLFFILDRVVNLLLSNHQGQVVFLQLGVIEGHLLLFLTLVVLFIGFGHEFLAVVQKQGAHRNIFVVRVFGQFLFELFAFDSGLFFLLFALLLHFFLTFLLSLFADDVLLLFAHKFNLLDQSFLSLKGFAFRVEFFVCFLNFLIDHLKFLIGFLTLLVKDGSELRLFFR